MSVDIRRKQPDRTTHWCRAGRNWRLRCGRHRRRLLPIVQVRRPALRDDAQRARNGPCDRGSGIKRHLIVAPEVEVAPPTSGIGTRLGRCCPDGPRRARKRCAYIGTHVSTFIGLIRDTYAASRSPTRRIITPARTVRPPEARIRRRGRSPPSSPEKLSGDIRNRPSLLRGAPIAGRGSDWANSHQPARSARPHCSGQELRRVPRCSMSGNLGVAPVRCVVA